MGYRIPQTYKTLDEVLPLVKQAIQSEHEDDLFYTYLISAAPWQEDKEIIIGIRDDERKHNRMFKELFKTYTGREVTSSENSDFKRPASYIEGLRQALFGELSAMEKYRDIIAGIPDRYYRDMVFEILTDELEHADKYNYLLAKNLTPAQTLSPSPTSKPGFTLEEAAEIAKELGIDFSKVLFDLEQFRTGLDVELEHGTRDPATNVTSDDPILTGKIALAHLNEFPDYYIRLTKLEEEAKAFWKNVSQ